MLGCVLVVSETENERLEYQQGSCVSNVRCQTRVYMIDTRSRPPMTKWAIYVRWRFTKIF